MVYREVMENRKCLPFPYPFLKPPQTTEIQQNLFYIWGHEYSSCVNYLYLDLLRLCINFQHYLTFLQRALTELMTHPRLTVI